MELGRLLSVTIFISSCCQLTVSVVEFTNIKCTPLDKDFSDFEYCYIKSVNRSYSYWSLKVKLFKIPVNNITLRFTFMKNTNGYKPYLFDQTIDACQFLQHRKNPLLRFIYGFFVEQSNMNHTCPYDHDLILEKLDAQFINSHLSRYLPMSDGEYAAFTTWTAYNKPRAQVNFYIRVLKSARK